MAAFIAIAANIAMPPRAGIPVILVDLNIA
jgi:hypothetical protein